jgi:hypothetical protein
MRMFRNLTLSFLLVLAAIGFTPAPTQAIPESLDSDCVWAYGGSGGVYSCSWGCDYFYEYNNGEWELVDQNCEALD